MENEITSYKDEVNRLLQQDLSKEASHELAIKKIENQASKSRKEIANISVELSKVQREKLSYQRQCTELKTALNSALSQLQVIFY